MSSDTPAAAKMPRAFISHSSVDKPFVRRLADDLKKENLNVWVDERELGVGDSIVAGVADALRDTDYVIAVLSGNSANSAWVQREIASATMDELSGKGVAVLPIRIDDADIPQLLKDKVYADFRTDYAAGLQRLLVALRQETSPVVPSSGLETLPTRSSCSEALENLTRGELRRRIDKRLDRTEVSVVWFDLFEKKMDDTLPNQEKPVCIIEMIDRAGRRDLLPDLIAILCEDYPHIHSTAKETSPVDSASSSTSQPSQTPVPSSAILALSPEDRLKLIAALEKMDSLSLNQIIIRLGPEISQRVSPHLPPLERAHQLVFVVESLPGFGLPLLARTVQQLFPVLNLRFR